MVRAVEDRHGHRGLRTPPNLMQLTSSSSKPGSCSFCSAGAPGQGPGRARWPEQEEDPSAHRGSCQPDSPLGQAGGFASEPNEVRLLHSPKNSRWGCPRATGCRARQTVKSVSPHLCLVWEAMTVGQRVPTPALMPWVPLRGAVLLGALGAVSLQAHAVRQRLSWGL